MLGWRMKKIKCIYCGKERAKYHHFLCENCWKLENETKKLRKKAELKNDKTRNI